MTSLRGRLTLGVTLVLAAVFLVLGELVSHYVDHSERATVDDRLERTATLLRATAITAVEQELPSNDSRLDGVLGATGSSLKLTLGAGTLLQAGRQPPKHDRPRAGLSTFTANGRHYRAYVATIRNEDLGGLLRLEVTASLTGVEHRQRAFRRRAVIVGVIALLLAGLGTWFAAFSVLRPLRRLRGRTSQIAAETDLSSTRVPDDDGPRELRELAVSFNGMLDRLGRSADDRSRALAATRRFAADAGHELRTPLTAVQATLSALARHPDVPVERRTSMLIDALADHARLVALLDGLQALARGDAIELDATDVDLTEVAADAVSGAASRHVDMSFDTDLPDDALLVRGWEPGLRRLVENLVENAANHSGGRSVHVTVKGSELVVEDDGRGIAAEDRARVFEPFTRLDGNTRPGSGLGLALVAQQAAHHGAEVHIDKSPLGGARFTVTFPAD